MNVPMNDPMNMNDPNDRCTVALELVHSMLRGGEYGGTAALVSDAFEIIDMIHSRGLKELHAAPPASDAPLPKMLP